MAGSARFTAMLDACVLYPAPMRDALLSLAAADLYTARWSEQIELEWTTALVARRPDLKDRLATTVNAMREAVPDWEVPARAYETLVEGITLPDVDDRHVLAAAIAGHCDCIVTANLKDFPASALDAYEIEAIHPDDFITLQLDLDPIQALSALKAMRKRLRNPELDPEAFISVFERNGMPTVGGRLRHAIDLL